VSDSLPIDLWGSKQGPRAERGGAAPAPALIHQNRNIGIESVPYVIRNEFLATQQRIETDRIIQQIPPRLRKKMFALRLKIEWMVRTYGVNHVGMQTMTIRENVTDRKEFERRFKSISTNVFPKLYLDWLRVFERQHRGAWHAHVVVVTKADTRTGTDVEGLNKLLKDKRDRKIPKVVYYSGIKRMASPNLKGLWKEFRRLCGIGEYKARRRGKRFYKFDACHLLPIISTAQALAVYVSKYISKGFEQRRPEDKGMRLVGSTRNVSRVCNERFSWADGGGKLHRLKLGILAKLLGIESLDGFAEMFGPKWAYHLQPAIALIELPYYENMRLAKLNGWDLKNDRGEPWPLPDLRTPKDMVRKSHLEAFVLAKEVWLNRQKFKPDREFKRFGRLRVQSEPLRLRPSFKSWLDYTAVEN
jgi:hypothetical protein